MSARNNLHLYLCDFGAGILRYDIARISIAERIDNNGEYKGNSLACEFDFKLMAWVRRVKAFLGWNRRLLK